MGAFETKAQRSRAKIADDLRKLADQLGGGGDVTLELGGKEVLLNPSDPVTFTLEAESDWSDGDTKAKQRIEFELVWRREARTAEDAALSIRE
ncbi:amphi-Trp domain-containing protein [Natronorubrum halophilum]|uniref:amphi-Trp domain-containing protein n=1 Tax=Natronorubrum halophilum TaxID=1702106 RepID=UPI000EF6B43F|nr:amphi-Trp domain-containing protein [Natronorubrum halophilum]